MTRGDEEILWTILNDGWKKEENKNWTTVFVKMLHWKLRIVIIWKVHQIFTKISSSKLFRREKFFEIIRRFSRSLEVLNFVELFQYFNPSIFFFCWFYVN